MSESHYNLLRQLVSGFEQLQRAHGSGSGVPVPVPSYTLATRILARKPAQVGATDLHHALYRLVKLYETAWRYHTNAPEGAYPNDPVYRNALGVVRPGVAI